MNKLPIYIIIPTHNRVDRLQLLLDSIVAATLPENLATIVVAENGSNVAKKSVEAYKDKLPIVYSHHEVGNKSRTLNEVIETIKEDALLLFFDDDIKISPNLIQQYENAINKFGRGYYFGGGLEPEYEKEPHPTLIPYMPLSNKHFDLSVNGNDTQFENFNFFLGANWACYKNDLDKIEGFSENFGPGASSKARGQESDAQRRLYEVGLRALAIHDAVASHWVPAKYVQEDWITDRILNSSVHRGKHAPSLWLSLVFLAKLTAGIFAKSLGNMDTKTRFRMANAIGYFKGMIS